MYGQPPPPQGYGYGYGAPPSPWANPYAAPAAPPEPPPPPGHGSWVKWAYAISLVLSATLVVLGMIAITNAAGDIDPATGAYDPPDEDLQTLGGVMTFGGLALTLVRFLAAFLWLYQAWSAIPAAYRYTKSRAVSPGQAVGYLFVPLYNLYWVFVANVGLCDAMDGALAAQGSSRRAPRVSAMIACILQVIPYVNFVLAPFAWLLYMFMFDAARSELLARLNAQGGVAPAPSAALLPGAAPGGWGPPPPGY